MNKDAGVTFAVTFGYAFHEESLFGPLFPRTLYGKEKGIEGTTCISCNREATEVDA